MCIQARKIMHLCKCMMSERAALYDHFPLSQVTWKTTVRQKMSSDSGKTREHQIYFLQQKGLRFSLMSVSMRGKVNYEHHLYF